MTSVKDIYGYIDSFAPFDTKAEWDNPGILIGNSGAKVTKAVVALDITAEEVKQAAENGAQLIISHHPVIFRAVKSMTEKDIGYMLISNGISAVCAHTNLDKAPGGVNDALCEALGMEYVKIPEPAGEGFLNAGTVAGIASPGELALHISRRLGSAVRYCPASETVDRIAVCSGAGADLFGDAAALGCDALITGDASYHDMLDAAAAGVSIFAAGHYETEIIIVKRVIEKLSAEFPDVEFIASRRAAPVITIKE